MATLTLRTVKGTPLTNQEVDDNFSNINTEVGVVFNRANTINSNVGVLSNLTTTEKSNLVAAINEIAAESSSNVTVTGGTISGTIISNSTWSGNTIAIAQGGTGATSASDARTALGVAIGSNVQAWSANLDAIAALDKTDGNFIVSDGSTWTVETGATARTSLGLGTIATQSASSVSITGGTITGLTNLAGSNATFTSNVVSQGNVAAVYFLGDGSKLSGISTGGSSGLFNTSISSATGYALTTSMANAYVAPTTSGTRQILHSIHITNISADIANVTAQIVGPTYSSISLGNTIPVPAGSAVELLKKPKILQPGDYIQLLEEDLGNLHATFTVEQSTNTAYFGVGVDITTAATYTDVHTATANSVIESILLANDDTLGLDVKATVVWTDGSNNIQGYFAYDLIVPNDATIEVLEQPKFLPNGYKIRVQTNQANRLETIIAGKTV